MNTARLSSQGQVTIPISVRRMLGLREGENVVFVEQSGNVMLASERDVKVSPSKGWSNEFIEQFSKFGDTPDETFVAPEEIPPEYNLPRVNFE